MYNSVLEEFQGKSNFFYTESGQVYKALKSDPGAGLTGF